MEQELAQAIELISAQLGVAVEKVFGTFVGAQPVIGILSIISTLVVIIGAYIVAKRARKMLINGMDDSVSRDDEITAIWIPIILALCAALMLYGAMDATGNAMLKIFCPEYTAMKEIIELATR